MNVRCPKCGAEYVLDDALLGHKVECSVCHQKFIVDGQERMAQDLASLRCPKLLKFLSICCLGLGVAIAFVSSLMCVDVAEESHWFGSFLRMMVGVVLVIGSYFFLVGRRLGRMFFAIGILLEVVNKSLVLPVLLWLPLGLSFSASASEWFARCAEVPCAIWIQFFQNLMKLKLWTKLLLGALLGLYVFLFLCVRG